LGDGFEHCHGVHGRAPLPLMPQLGCGAFAS
jgi:hypothetical protein